MLRSKVEMAAVFHRDAPLTVKKKNKKNVCLFSPAAFFFQGCSYVVEALCGLLGLILTEKKILPVARLTAEEFF